MSFGFELNDYRIRSLNVFRGAVIAYALIHVAIILAEFFLELQSTSFDILIPTGIVSILVVGFCFRYPESARVRWALVLLMYSVVEVHFLYNPKVFHVIGYWFPLIPLLSLILQGMRAAQLMFLVTILTQVGNAFYLQGNVGSIYQAEIGSTPFLASSLIFTVSILSASFLLYTLLGEAYSKTHRENAELVALKKAVEDKRYLLERYLQTVISFSKDERNFNQGRVHLFRAVCRTIAPALNTGRVSVWLMENANSRLERRFMFENGNETDETVVLSRNEYPAYFQALEARPFIQAQHARAHPETREFGNGYLEENDILSMLDCPIMVDGRPIGVICCEHQHRTRNWDAEDTLFVQSMTDFISISFKNERITNLLFEVRKKNSELVEKNNEIETMNEELHSLNEELSTVNETLEQTVKHRTRELETQNVQLTEYAFINSHLLRAPLSRIMGLSQLISAEAKSVNDVELIEALIHSTNELDAIIRRISEVLYDGNNLTRENIKEIIDRNLNQPKS